MAGGRFTDEDDDRREVLRREADVLTTHRLRALEADLKEVKTNVEQARFVLARLPDEVRVFHGELAELEKSVSDLQKALVRLPQEYVPRGEHEKRFSTRLTALGLTASIGMNVVQLLLNHT